MIGKSSEEVVVSTKGSLPWRGGEGGAKEIKSCSLVEKGSGAHSPPTNVVQVRFNDPTAYGCHRTRPTANG